MSCRGRPKMLTSLHTNKIPRARLLEYVLRVFSCRTKLPMFCIRFSLEKNSLPQTSPLFNHLKTATSSTRSMKKRAGSLKYPQCLNSSLSNCTVRSLSSAFSKIWPSPSNNCQTSSLNRFSKKKWMVWPYLTSGFSTTISLSSRSSLV